MKVEKKDLPDADWTRAADVVLDASRDYHREIGAARVVVTVLRSPSGESLPYLMAVEELDAADRPIGKGRALVHDGKLVTGGGAEAAGAYLHGRGFPGKPVDAGLLCEVLDLFGAVPVEWLVLPSAKGWPALDDTNNLINHKPVELEYGGGRATLRLFRAGQSVSHGGDAPTPIERMSVEFDTDGRIASTRAERQDPGGAWKPLP